MRMHIFPEQLAAAVLQLHDDHIYKPLRVMLEGVAGMRRFPTAVSPNMVTVASVSCALPFVLLNLYGWHRLAASLCIFHDILDRMDGAVAGALRKRAGVIVEGPRVYLQGRLIHDGEFGAYLDAMGDKAFGVCALLGFCAIQSVPSPLKVLFALKFPLHMALAIVRTQDYYGRARANKHVALSAVGAGKLSTCAENFCHAMLSFGLAYMGSTLGSIALCATGILSLISTDMGLRSLSHKLMSRA